MQELVKPYTTGIMHRAEVLSDYLDGLTIPKVGLLSKFERIGPESDDTGRLQRLHAYANANNVPVVYDVAQNLLVDAKADIPVYTSVDFGGCVLIPVFTSTPNYDYTPVFRIKGKESINVSDQLDKASMRKGELALYGNMRAYHKGTFWVNSDAAFCKRAYSDAAPNYYKSSIGRITKNGALQYPLEHDFSTATTVTAWFRPDETDWLTITGLGIDTSNMLSGVVFKIERSQVTVKDLCVQQLSAVPVQNIRHMVFIGEGVSQINFDNVSAEGMSAFYADQGTYVIGGNYCCQISISRFTALQGFGCTGFSKTRDLRVTDSTLNRVDGHYHIYDIMVTNTVMHELGVYIGMGGGYLKLDNVHRYIGTLTDYKDAVSNLLYPIRLSMVFMRPDYGDYFDGSMSVTNCTLTVGRDISFPNATENAPAVISCISFNAGANFGSGSTTGADFGYSQSVPWGTSITIDNFKVSLLREGAYGAWITVCGINYNRKWVLPSVTFPGNITVRNIGYNATVQQAKVTPIIFPDLLHTISTVIPSNKRFRWNSIIDISDIASGFVDSRASFGSLGATSLDALYSMPDIEQFPADAVVPRINVRGFYGFTGKWTIPGQLNIQDSMILGISDISSGRHPDCWCTIKDSTIYPVVAPGGAVSVLPRAQYSNTRFINSGIAPNLTDADSVQGCTFENGVTPIGVTTLEAWTGVVKDGAGRLV